MAKRWNTIALEAHGNHDVMFFQEDKKLVVPGILRKLVTEGSLEILNLRACSAVSFEIPFWRENVKSI